MNDETCTTCGQPAEDGKCLETCHEHEQPLPCATCKMIEVSDAD